MSVGGQAQPKAYGHALGLHPLVSDHAWALVIDLDEFLVLNPDVFGTIGDFPRWHETTVVDAIALNWVIIGSDNDPRHRDVLLTRRFRRRLGSANAHIKTLFRPGSYVHSGPHFPHAAEGRRVTFRNAAGEPHVFDLKNGPDSPALSISPDMSFACIFHHFFNSADDFLWKFARNRGDFILTPGLSIDALIPPSAFPDSQCGLADAAPS